jgi:hypothetical protein
VVGSLNERLSGVDTVTAVVGAVVNREMTDDRTGLHLSEHIRTDVGLRPPLVGLLEQGRPPGPVPGRTLVTHQGRQRP